MPGAAAISSAACISMTSGTRPCGRSWTASAAGKSSVCAAITATTATWCWKKKSKVGGLCAKEQTCLTRPQAQALLVCDFEALAADPAPLMQELLWKMHVRDLRPKTIVDYTREPFVFASGNVRVTLDYELHTGLSSTDFFDFRCPTIPAGDTAAVLEVKWDEYLPAVIRDLVQVPSARTGVFSKYAICRIYG